MAQVVNLDEEETAWELELSDPDARKTLLEALRRQITVFSKIEEIKLKSDRNQVDDWRSENQVALNTVNTINAFLAEAKAKAEAKAEAKAKAKALVEAMMKENVSPWPKEEPKEEKKEAQQEQTGSATMGK